MSLIYGLVARGSVILAEHTSSTGNFTQVTQAILEKIPPNNSKLTYVYDRYLFHYICEDGLTYMCMADDSFGRRIPFTFLQDIKQRFRAAYNSGAIEAAPPYGMHEFSQTISKLMEYYSTNTNADKLKQVHGEIEQVKDVMVHNIGKSRKRVLERGERIELLVDKTDNLNQQAFAFKKRSTQLKRSMWWKNTKLMAVLALVVVLIIYFIVSFACGFPVTSIVSRALPFASNMDNLDTVHPYDQSPPKSNPVNTKQSELPASVQFEQWRPANKHTTPVSRMLQKAEVKIESMRDRQSSEFNFTTFCKLPMKGKANHGIHAVLEAEDVDELMVKYSVPDLRRLQRTIGHNVELRRQDLRTLVGERYRDLLSATDSISAMKRDASRVQGIVKNASEELVHEVIEKRIEGHLPHPNESNDHTRQDLYKAAALIKLLVDVPEQIWQSLDANEYLSAAQMYGIAKAAYDTICENEQIETAFTIAHRQWDAIAHLKGKIVERGIAFLSKPEQTIEAVTCTVCALILLNEDTKKDTLRRLTQMRLRGIESILQSSQPATQKLSSALQLVIDTVSQLYAIYMPLEVTADVPWLDVYTERLRSGTLFIPVTDNSDPKSKPTKNYSLSINDPTRAILAKLYSPSTNVNLLSRHLPNIVLKAPMLEPQLGDTLDHNLIRTTASSWLDQAIQVMHRNLPIILAQIPTAHDLFQLRSNLHTLVATSTTFKPRGPKPKTWAKMCEVCFDNVIDIENLLIQGAFDDHYAIMLADCFQVVWAEVQPLISAHKTLEPAPRETDRAPWQNDADIASFRNRLDDDFFVGDSITLKVRETIDNALRRIKRDLVPSLYPADNLQPSTPGQPLDFTTYRQEYRNTWARTMNEFCQQLVALSKPDINGNQDDKLCLAVGQIALAIALDSTELSSGITSTGENVRIPPADENEAEEVTRVIRKRFVQVYEECFLAYLDTLSKTAAEGVALGLSNSRWDDQMLQYTTWEASSPGGTQDDQAALPTHCSPFITQTLYQVCNAINAIGVKNITTTILAQLQSKLASAILQPFIDFSAAKPDITQRGAIQLLFDIRYIQKLFDEQSHHASGNRLEEQRFRNVVDTFRSLIDPIDLTSFEKPLMQNVEKQQSRTSLLFGLLFRPTESTQIRRKVSTLSDMHNVLPMATQIPRFILLPIAE